MRISRVKIILVLVLLAVSAGFIAYGWVFHAQPFLDRLLGREAVEDEVQAEDYELDPRRNHPFLQALSNLPRNTSLVETTGMVTVSQRLPNESFRVTELHWEEDRLYLGEKEIRLVEVSDVPYAFLLMQNPERRVLQFNRERSRQEILSNLRNQNVMTGLYLSSQSEVDNLVIETILEGFTLTSFYATDNWLYALFTYGAEDKLIWWDGSHLTLAGNFRR